MKSILKKWSPNFERPRDRSWSIPAELPCADVGSALNLAEVMMGILDAIEGMAGQGDNARVAGGLMPALDERPGGLGSVIDSFRQNGMEQHVQTWPTGQQTTATPEQVQQGLRGTGLIERVAGTAGVSLQVALGTISPIVIAHFTQGGRAAPRRVDLVRWLHRL